MKFFAVVLLCIASIGCARYDVKPPLINHTASLAELKPSTLNAEELPDRPVSMAEVSNFVSVAERNTEVLIEILLANNSLIKERNNLVIMAKEIQRHSNALAIEWANTEEQRRKAEDLRTIETTVYRLLILIGLSLAL